MKETAKKKGMSKEAMVGIGAGVAAAAAAVYLLFGPEGKQNRKHVKGWAVKMKGEIIEHLEKAKELSEPVYREIVDKVHEKYSKIKNMDQVELAAFVADLHKHWKGMSKMAHEKAGSRKSHSSASKSRGAKKGSARAHSKSESKAS
jgi:gas vesicle protein